MKTLIMTVFFFFLKLNTASSIVFEPGGGLIVGSFSQSFTDIVGDDFDPDFDSEDATVTGTVAGFEVNSKFYYQFKVFTNLNLGLDLNSSFLSLKPTVFTFDGSKIPTYTALKFQGGIGFGISPESRWLPHLWFSYFPLDVLALSDGEISNSYSGNGTKIGIGFGTKIKFSIEFKKSTYNKRDGHRLPVRYEYEEHMLTEHNLVVDEVLFGISFPVKI